MARSPLFTGAARASVLGLALLTTMPALVLPVAAQEQPAPPAIAAPEAPALDGAQEQPAAPAATAPEAPVLPQAATTVESPPTLPGTDEAAPALNTSPATEVAPAQTLDPVGEPTDQTRREHHGRGGPEHGGLGQGGPENGNPRDGAPLPHELSPWGMFMAADWIVKGVMIGLAFATFVTLTVLIYKFVEVALAKRSLRRATRVIRGADTLPGAAAALKGRRDPAAFMTQAALEELTKSAPALDVAGVDGVKERTRSILERTEAQAGRHLMRGTGLLATIGSTAPFVGLFGTVWGIMNSFIGISKSQTTNLAVVAPGIAEALLATAIGLVAAIPAVIIYNHFARQITGYRLALGDAGAGVERLLSRDLDFRRV